MENVKVEKAEQVHTQDIVEFLEQDEFTFPKHSPTELFCYFLIYAAQRFEFKLVVDLPNFCNSLLFL